MTPVVAFVGFSGVGKTTFLEKLLPELVARGLKVCFIKHHHGPVRMDRPGKDTDRLKKAGATRTILQGQGEVGLVADLEGETSLLELVEQFGGDADLVIAEGYKNEPAPKIKIQRSGHLGDPLDQEDPLLIAIVTDDPGQTAVPSFGLDDPSAVADFLNRRIRRGD